MDKVVFFSRCQLTNLYGQLLPYISDDYEVLHIAFSDEEEGILRNNFGIKYITNFQKECGQLLANEKLDEEYIGKIDNEIITYTNGRFNLNAAIQMDRTFEYLKYEESLLLVQTYYRFWEKYIVSNDVKFLIHELTSLFFNHIAAILLKKYNRKYITPLAGYGKEKYSFMFLSGDDANFDEYYWTKNDFNELDLMKIEEAKLFQNKFNENSENLLQGISKKIYSVKELFYDILKVTWKAIMASISLMKLDNNLIYHVERYHLKCFSWSNDVRRFWKTYFYLKFDDFDSNQTYFYYPLHLEPEAVVLYWGDGIYKNQVKLIENIAGQLPPNTFLYVKGHPHEGRNRDYEDYVKIKAIPNVKLLHPSISGKSVIACSKGVITINGTSGFEALLMNKQVYTFGHSFYKVSNRVQYVEHIRDLRRYIYQNIDKEINDDNDLYEFISIYLSSVHTGFTEYFTNFHKMLNIQEEENAKIVAAAFNKYFKKSNKNIYH